MTTFKRLDGLIVLLMVGMAGIAALAADVQRWYMNEEWYDWHPHADFKPLGENELNVEIHFVGPGAVTPRGIYIRGDADQPLDRITVHAIKDHAGTLLVAEPASIEVQGTPENKKWVRLARGSFRRGYEPLMLKLPAGVTFDYVCVSPNNRYVTHGRAERWVRDHERGKEVRSGMPMGGIGAGKVEIARDGWLCNLTTNNNIDAPFHHPDKCFLAASIDNKARILRDGGAMGLKPVETVRFDARYPIANLTFADSEWPIDLKLTAWSPMDPGNVDDSSIPVAVFDFTIENTTSEKIAASVAVSWENLLGSGGRPQPMSDWKKTGHYLRFSEPQGNVQEIIRVEGLEGVLFHGGAKTEPDGEGNYTLATMINRTPSGYMTTMAANANPDAWKDYIATGVFRETEPSAGNAPAAIAVYVSLPPGRKMTIPIAFAWHMDHFHQLGTEDLGHFYAKHFEDSKQVAQYVLFLRERLFEGTRRLEALFDRSDLPEWLTHALLNDLYVQLTDAWLTRDGRFSVNEGATNMYGVMGTMDQKLYASHHLALLFPELQMQELRQFGQLQHDHGGIAHDLGAGRFVVKNEAFDWPDLCSAFSILSWQVYRYTGDRMFWQEMRPKVFKAIDALGTTWDPDDTGVPGHGSTFDDEDSYRIFSYTTGLYLTVLKLGVEIAREANDVDRMEDYQERYDRALALAMKELWTGDYFRYGSSPAKNKRTDASHFSQLAGEFWAAALGFDGNYDTKVRDKALASLFRLHWNDNFKLPPKIVQPDGTLFPRDGEHRNAPVSWPMHSRAMMCGNAFFYGAERQGWGLLKAMRDNIIEANGPDPWDQSLYGDPVTAPIDWGVFYMTAPASWLAYQALIDTHYDAVTQTLTLRPIAAAKVTPGRFPVIAPAFHAMGNTSPDGRQIGIEFVRVLADKPQIRTLRLPKGFKNVEVQVDGRAKATTFENDRCTFTKPVVLTRKGQRIDVQLIP